MKLLAISGSLKNTSSNTAIVKAIKRIANNVDVTIYTALGDLPHFNPDLDNEDAPETVSAFRELIRSNDAVLFCTPEYAFGMPGVLKNALDWTVSSGEFVEKHVIALSASPSFMGGDKALSSLVLTLSALSAVVPQGAQLSIPGITKKLDEEGELIDQSTEIALKGVLLALTESLEKQNILN